MVATSTATTMGMVVAMATMGTIGGRGGSTTRPMWRHSSRMRSRIRAIVQPRSSSRSTASGARHPVTPTVTPELSHPHCHQEAAPRRRHPRSLLPALENASGLAPFQPAITSSCTGRATRRCRRALARPRVCGVPEAETRAPGPHARHLHPRHRGHRRHRRHRRRGVRPEHQPLLRPRREHPPHHPRRVRALLTSLMWAFS
mmetsp:Transcript_85973/g.242859  ORF Transcript_85973/g.242859 Transcript_85973/m.242859 type:complete len:201 (+) Transcript_85973:627-1229(+)